MTKTEMLLVQKLARAKMHLENVQIKHHASCGFGKDPEYEIPCSCGAETEQRKVDNALSELDLDFQS